MLPANSTETYWKLKGYWSRVLSLLLRLCSMDKVAWLTDKDSSSPTGASERGAEAAPSASVRHGRKSALPVPFPLLAPSDSQYLLTTTSHQSR
jgi:hypothetical protein